MAKIMIAAVIILSGGFCYSYTAKMNINAMEKELKIRIDYSFSGENTEIKLPERARLVSLFSPSTGNIKLNNNAGNIVLNQIQYNYRGQISLIYTIQMHDIEFYLKEWIPSIKEEGNILVNIAVPQGFKGLIIPHMQSDQGGFEINPGENPILVCSKYKLDEYTDRGRKYSFYYPFQFNSGFNAIKTMLNTMESVLSPLPEKDMEFITLPALGNYVKITGGTVFLTINNTSAEEIKSALLYLWFKEILKQDEKWSYALKDLFCRILDEKGGLRQDPAYIIPVPSYDYYKNTVKEGFQKGDSKNNILICDVNNMLKNFAMLHLAYYTIGLSPFLDRIKIFSEAAGGIKTDLKTLFCNDPAFSGPDINPVIEFIFDNLLPVASFVPDISINGHFLYRNNDNIPDITLQVGVEKRTVPWNNKRAADLGNFTGLAFPDPGYSLPQLNFYNDKFLTNPKDAAEWKAVSFAVSQHKHFDGESFRDILDLEKFISEDGNVYGIPPGNAVYTAVIKIITPFNGKLVTALKELILTVNNGKPLIITDRIRI